MHTENIAKMKDMLMISKSELLDSLRDLDIETVYDSAFTLITYERIFNLFYEDPDFQTEAIVNKFIETDGMIVGELLMHCITSNVINLDSIREVCLNEIASILK